VVCPKEVVLRDQRIIPADQLPVGMAIEAESGRQRHGLVRLELRRVDRLGDGPELLEIGLQPLRVFRCADGDQLLPVDIQIDLVPCTAERGNRIEHWTGERGLGISGVAGAY
jgi:hypothetical protein